MAMGSQLVKEVERMHIGFLRSCLGVRRQVPALVVLLELQREPIYLRWLRQNLKLWNRVSSRDDDDLLKVARKERCRLVSGGVQVWASYL